MTSQCRSSAPLVPVPVRGHIDLVDGSPSIPRIRVAYIVDPRFPGGTSSAFAEELKTVAGLADVSVHAIDTKMFRGRPVSGQIEAALDETGLALQWGSPVVGADLVVLHNPVMLKYDGTMRSQIVAKHLIVVAHENFLRPDGAEGFAVAHSLDVIGRASLALRRSVAPISANNRTTVRDWLLMNRADGWDLLDADWFNICAHPVCRPTSTPADRRGRHSRPGFEKFPAIDVLDRCFPASAACNVILGADNLMADGIVRPHWTMLPFKALPLNDYFGMIDFLVYFTSATWRESFGRVMAEGIAAGKVVISDVDTAKTFSGGAIAADPHEVDRVIAKLVQEPALYRDHVLQAQRGLQEFSQATFREMFARVAHAAARGTA